MLVIQITSNTDPLYNREINITGKATIGRESGCDIELPDPDRYVSRLHAVIQDHQGQWSITVTSKTNGVMINHAQLNTGETALLDVGSQIQLHCYNLNIKKIVSSQINLSPLFSQENGPFHPSSNAENQTGNKTLETPVFAPPSSDQLLSPLIDQAASVLSDRPQLDKFVPTAKPPAIDDAKLINTPPIHQPLNTTTSAIDLGDIDDFLRGLGQIPSTQEDIKPTNYQTKAAATTQNHVKNDDIETARAELIDAFRLGAQLGPREFTQQQAIAFMQSSGQITRLLIETLTMLLASRSMLKGELSTEDRTMIATRDNNPLKLLPDANASLAFLLDGEIANPQVYMQPQQSLQTACDDLIRHELGKTAAIRAAIESVVRRFAPQNYEQQLDESGKKIILNKKASLWELYEQDHQAFCNNLADEVTMIFNHEFRITYENVSRKKE